MKDISEAKLNFCRVSDIAIILFLIFFSQFIGLVIVGFTDYGLLGRYWFSFCLGGIPLFWLICFRKGSFFDIGFSNGQWTRKQIFLWGTFCGFLGFLLLILPFSYENFFRWSPDKSLYLHFLLTPLNPSGFEHIIFSPFCEEIFFRGLLLTFLISRFSTRVTLILQALLFAFLHFEFRVSHILSLFCLGLLLGYLYILSRSLHPSIIAHATISWLSLWLAYVTYN